MVIEVHDTSARFTAEGTTFEEYKTTFEKKAPDKKKIQYLGNFRLSEQGEECRTYTAHLKGNKFAQELKAILQDAENQTLKTVNISGDFNCTPTKLAKQLESYNNKQAESEEPKFAFITWSKLPQSNVKKNANYLINIIKMERPTSG